MALVQCKNCGADTSDKALTCPKCGTSLIEEILVACEDCGTEYVSTAEACPNCGCPNETLNKEDEAESESEIQKVEVSKISIDKSTKKKLGKFAIIGVIAVVIIAIAISVASSNNSKNYKENLSSAVSAMLLGGIEAEDAGSLIYNVWHDAIYDDYNSETYKYTSGTSDFNEALSNLFADEDFKATQDSIKTNQDTVESLMRDLSNPPSEYEDAYAALKECYDAYLEFTNLATNPTGSLSTYTSSYNSAQSSFINAYDAMDLYTDE